MVRLCGKAGPKNAIFDLAMPSQIRWAVSQTAQNFVIPCPSPPSCASMVGLFVLPQRVQLLVTCAHLTSPHPPDWLQLSFFVRMS